jgi:aspartyl-tRNA(Asn)/glutamyl-tRNA(Gln) amidotransferase subunit C
MIERNEVLRIAALARLELSPEELERMTADLSEILGYVDQLARVEGDARVAAATEGTPLREDRVLPSRWTAELLEAAPEREGPLVKVPRVVE